LVATAFMTVGAAPNSATTYHRMSMDYRGRRWTIYLGKTKFSDGLRIFLDFAVQVCGGYGWTRTTDPSIMSAVL
jgi:hypothetical protein